METIEIPKYKCAKTVHALEIERVKQSVENDGYVIVPSDKRYAPFNVSREYHDKHFPKAGGYYVRYKDGYESFSPTEAFENGYELIP